MFQGIVLQIINNFIAVICGLGMNANVVNEGTYILVYIFLITTNFISNKVILAVRVHRIFKSSLIDLNNNFF